MAKLRFFEATHYKANNLNIFEKKKTNSEIYFKRTLYLGLPQWLSGTESTCSAGVTGDTGSIPGSGRSPGGEHGNPLQYSCPENPMDRGALWTTVHVVARVRYD